MFIKGAVFYYHKRTLDYLSKVPYLISNREKDTITMENYKSIIVRKLVSVKLCHIFRRIGL